MHNCRLQGNFFRRNVVNISKKTLPSKEIALPLKGFKFSTIPNDVDRAQLKSDIGAMNRRKQLR